MFDLSRDQRHVLRWRDAQGFLPKLLLAALLSALLAATYGAAAAQASQVPVAAYSFDEGSGSTVKDSARSHDGTINGATWASVGKYGSALDFDGVNDLVSITDAPDLDLTSSFTLEAWVRPDTLTASRPVIAKSESAGGNSGYLLSARYTGNPTGFVASAGAAKSVVRPSPLPEAVWSHLAFTSDGTNLHFYIDGKLAATAPAIAAKATAASLVIGYGQVLGGYFDGMIDEVRLYDVARSESEIQVDRDTAVGLDQIPVAAYSFDEGSGTTVKDAIGSHTGTISGATWSSSGKYGSALSFDGTNDLVSIVDAADLDLTSTFTLDAWVNPTSTTAARPVISKGETSGGNSGYALSARYTSTPPAGIVASSGTLKSVAAPSALKTGEWSHLALTSDGTTLRLYVNGSFVTSVAAISAKATTAPLEIGHSFLGGYFEGKIDEVRIYNETLPESQIQVDRDNRVQTPAPTEVTTNLLDTGPSSELVSSVPITASGSETVVYSLAVPTTKAGEVLRATGNLQLTNTHNYDVSDSVRLVLGANASDTNGSVVTPWTHVQQTKSMLHWTFPINGIYRSPADVGSTRYLKVIVKTASPSAQIGDTLKVQPNFGGLTATRYSIAQGPMSQPTHQLQSLTDPVQEQITTIPVDSVWRRVLTRRLTDLSVDDVIDLTGQLSVQNTSGTTVQLESMVKMTTAPSTGGSTASPPIADRLTSDMSADRIVHGVQFQVTDPAKRYLNLLVRAVPIGSSPKPLTISAGSATLSILRMDSNPGTPIAPLKTGTVQLQRTDFSADVSSIPFAVSGGSEKRVVASVPLRDSLWKGEVLQGRGFVVTDLNGGDVTQILTQLVLGDTPTDTTGDVVAKLSGDKVPATTPIHTSIKEGAYIMPRAESVTKYLNYVVYASQANPSGNMNILEASASFTRSRRTAAVDEGFETGTDMDGLDSVFEYEYNGVLSASSAVAREGNKSLLVDLDLSSDFPGDDDKGGIRRNEVRPPDIRSAAGYFGEDSWHGFSAYFPSGFHAPGPEQAKFFKGLIDEVRIYDVTLSQEDIQADRDGNYQHSSTPIAFYAFNEGTGSTATDSAGNHDGLIKGATWMSSGKYGSAVGFDGLDDQVTVSDSPDFDLTGSFTLEAWVSPETLANMVPVISKFDLSVGSGYGLVPSVGALDNVSAGIVAGSGDVTLAPGSQALPTQQWSHLAFTSDGTSLRLYVDGQLIATAGESSGSHVR